MRQYDLDMNGEQIWARQQGYGKSIGHKMEPRAMWRGKEMEGGEGAKRKRRKRRENKN